MKKYRFDEIDFNCTEKKKQTEADKDTYLGLEHWDSGCLTVSRFGSDIAPIGEKLIMKKGDVLFGKRRAYQKKVAIAPLMEYSLLMNCPKFLYHFHQLQILKSSVKYD